MNFGKLFQTIKNKVKRGGTRRVNRSKNIINRNNKSTRSHNSKKNTSRNNKARGTRKYHKRRSHKRRH